ncbi:MAG: RNA-binding protein [Hespellia sp.]|jgi:RNA-binding protein YlmH|nr:RNA-binding protein [Hespellia sp.]
MQKEEQLLAKRLEELSRTAYHRNIVTYSDFLNLNELNILHSFPKSNLYTRYETFGGYEMSERQMVAFIPDALCCETNYPILPLRIQPTNKKYAEELSHRDYLGAILNLGINRSKIGDILVEQEEAILFTHRSLQSFFTQELTKIRHTLVTVSPMEQQDFIYQPKFEEIKGTVASLRLDALLALAFPASRTRLAAVIEAARVFVNGRLITSNGYQIKEGDIISVRKLGKFQYVKMLSKTKKNRILVMIYKYI